MSGLYIHTYLIVILSFQVYDYGSVMHYGRTAFSKNGLETITPKMSQDVTIGQRNGMSTTDIAELNAVYG